MSEREKQELRKKILELESYIEKAREVIKYLKDIAWERDSKKESSKMYKVLENEKPSTIVKSNIGNVVVDRGFMEKEVHKHLNNPALRGMVTTEEVLSFPKVARNVKAEIDKKHKNFTWKAKADDESVLAYGSREYVKDDKEINRLLTAHSKTESNERMAEVDRRGHPYHSIFNDFNFRKSANNEIIPQNEQNSVNKEEKNQNQSYDPNDSSAMDMFRREHFEKENSTKQETEKQNSKNTIKHK